jgi:hypothetical protein
MAGIEVVENLICSRSATGERVGYFSACPLDTASLVGQDNVVSGFDIVSLQSKCRVFLSTHYWLKEL